MHQAVASETFTPLTPFMAARGYQPGGPFGLRPPGAELPALAEAAADVRAAITAGGTADAVTTCDLVTLPYPTRFGLWRAGLSPAPFLFLTNRMLVVQWTDADGVPRTLLWEPSDHERGEYTPYFESLQQSIPGFVPRSLFSTRHGTVLEHLAGLGVDPADVDYLAFDHLHTQDVRRLIGTTRPAADLGSPDAPVRAWFPNAKLLTQVREWEAIRHLHPLQRRWYQPDTYTDLDPDRLAFVDGDVLLGPGVALLFTPGHTAGNMSLAVSTATGIWTSSENGIAAESWAPRASRIPGVRRWCSEWGQEVVLNANTLEFAGWQYNSMVAEALVADPTSDGDFRQTFPSSELTSHPLAPLTAPTYVHERIDHGTIRTSA